MYFVYFLRSLKNNKIYTGTTSKEPSVRLIEHNSGTNSFTRQNGPFTLEYFEEYHCKTCTLKRERFYKSGFGRKIRDSILSSVSARGGSACG